MKRKNLISILLLIIALSSCTKAVKEEEPFEPITVNSQEISPHHIRFLMQKGQISRAFSYYQTYQQQRASHDFELLRQMCRILLEKGSNTPDPEIQLLTIYGAGITSNESLLHIIQTGSQSRYLEVQLAALNFLFSFHNNRADKSINKVMSSNFLISRVEAAYYLALRRRPEALGQIEALMYKVPTEVRYIFPELLAMLKTPKASNLLRQLLNDADEMTKIQSVLNVGYYQYYDLLPTIHNLSTRLNATMQEACAITLGMLEDREPIEKIKKMTTSTVTNVRLAAWHALYRLGDMRAKDQIEKIARKGNLFAIRILGETADSEETLASLVESKNIQIRINAAISLLERKDPRCIKALQEILIQDERGLNFRWQLSTSHGMGAWKVISAIDHKSKHYKYQQEITTSMRENTLINAINLPEEFFLQLASQIFSSNQKKMIPTLVSLLENLKSEESIQLLKKGQQQLGAPFVRNYCKLALFRLNEEGEYGEKIKEWVQEQNETDLSFRPILPKEKGGKKQEQIQYQLTPEETSFLLIDTYKTLAIKQNDYAIDILIKSMETGNKKNKYALAGLLLLAIE